MRRRSRSVFGCSESGSGRSGSSSPGRATKGFLTLALGSLDPELRIAFDFRHESWVGVELPENAVRINDVEAKAPFRYLRFRDPPYTDRAIERIADDIRPLLASGIEVFAYFRHEDEPTAPRSTPSGCSSSWPRTERQERRRSRAAPTRRARAPRPC